MKNVYIYNKSLELIATPYITNENDFIEEPKKFFPDFLDECYYSLKSLTNPVIEGDKIREMTKVEVIKAGIEKLKDGEYIESGEIIIIEKPSNYHIWDNKTNKWNYDKQLEIKSLNEELADLEGALLIKYDDLDKAITRKLKTLQKRLNTEIEELSLLIDEKYLKLEELEV